MLALHCICKICFLNLHLKIFVLFSDFIWKSSGRQLASSRVQVVKSATDYQITKYSSISLTYLGQINIKALGKRPHRGQITHNQTSIIIVDDVRIWPVREKKCYNAELKWIQIKAISMRSLLQSAKLWGCRFNDATQELFPFFRSLHYHSGGFDFFRMMCSIRVFILLGFHGFLCLHCSVTEPLCYIKLPRKLKKRRK